MRGTIKGKLTTAVIIIVVFAMLASTGSIVGYSGNKLKSCLTTELQINADKYADSINSWIEKEKGLNYASSVALAAIPDSAYTKENIQKMVTAQAEGHDEFLNLYYGMRDSQHFQMDPNAVPPEGYDPTQRGWYKSAAQAGTTIVTDPYMDVLIGGMCITIATPVYRNGELAGVIGADFTLDYISEVVDSIDYENGEYGFLVDAADKYIMHENEKYLPGEDTAVAVSDVMPGVDKVIKNPGNEVLLSTDYDGQKNYFATSSIEGCNWILGLVMPKNNLNIMIIKLIVLGIIITVVALVIVVIIMTKLIGQQLAPMENMKVFITEKIIGDKNVKDKVSEVEQIKYLLEELENRVVDTIHKTQDESRMIKDKMSVASDKINGINGSISEINDAIHRTESGIESQMSSIQSIGKICDNVTKATDSFESDTRGMNDKTDEIITRVKEMVPEIKVFRLFSRLWT